MFEFIFMGVIGLLFLTLGLLIWKKQKITLIHSYHYKNVKEESKPAYTAKMGKALIVMSIGMFLTGIVDCMTGTAYGWICFGTFFVTGFILVFITQKKYNGGLF